MVRVVHFESGLGNQMLDYCDFIAIKKMNPTDKCYAEDMVYDIPECGSVICQWNGLEIENIFGIQLNNLKTIFSDEQWNQIIDEVRSSKFWDKDWNYPKYIVQALKHQGLELHSEFLDFEEVAKKTNETKWLKSFIRSDLGQSMKRIYRRVVPQIEPISSSFTIKPYNTYEGHTLSYMFKGTGIEKIENEIKTTFVFPTLDDKKNRDIVDEMRRVNSIAIHIRAGDAMSYNKKYFERNYIQKAIRFMNSKVENPKYYIFGNPDGLNWFRTNLYKMPIKEDNIVYVDWNSGDKSYIDMHLMSMCKHNIMLFSSFAWWGSYLNSNPNKITIAPEPIMLATHWF